MREILFRGKVKNGFEWLYGYLSQTTIVGKETYNSLIISKPTEKLHEHEWEEVLFETVGQYTGLTDKNGTKIFEGDIVDILTENEEIGVVEYEDGCFIVSSDGFTVTFYSNINGEDVEVIGNIHDNPEMLKE